MYIIFVKKPRQSVDDQSRVRAEHGIPILAETQQASNTQRTRKMALLSPLSHGQRQVEQEH